MYLKEYHQRILELATKWRLDLLTPEENTELNNWYQAIEYKPLGPPMEVAVDRLEQLLYEQFEKNRKPIQNDEEPPPFPFPLKKD
jgi:hypothetical protein